MNVNVSENGVLAEMPTVGPPAMPQGGNAGRANAKLLGGASVKVVTSGGNPDLEPTAVLLSMMQAHYQTLLAIARNMGESKEASELRKRRREELAEQIRDLKDRKVDYEQARITFINSMDSAADRAFFEKRMAEMRPAVMA